MRHKSNCRRGTHALGRRIDVGGGIHRQICRSCGAVVIDLRPDAEIEDSKLFASQRTDTIFAIQSALQSAHGPLESGFGKRRLKASVPSNVS